MPSTSQTSATLSRGPRDGSTGLPVQSRDDLRRRSCGLKLKKLGKFLRGFTKNCSRRKDKKKEAPPLELSFPSVLPKDCQLEILSFLYDDCTSIYNFQEAHSFICETVSEKELKRHVSLEILNSPQSQVLCRVCDQMLCYPYQLAECSHQVCGRCAWQCRHNMEPCGCGVKLRSRPVRLDSSLADCRASWVLESEGKTDRF